MAAVQAGAEILATIPGWVIPTHEQVMDLLRAMNGPTPGGDHGFGREEAARWATDITWSTPMSRRNGDRPVSWAEARAECWMAVCAAAEAAPPTAREWSLLGALPRNTVASDPDYAHGVWEVLGWLLGERPDPPAPAATGGGSTVEFTRRWEATRRCVEVRERITGGR